MPITLPDYSRVEDDHGRQPTTVREIPNEMPITDIMFGEDSLTPAFEIPRYFGLDDAEYKKLLGELEFHLKHKVKGPFYFDTHSVDNRVSPKVYLLGCRYSNGTHNEVFNFANRFPQFEMNGGNITENYQAINRWLGHGWRPTCPRLQLECEELIARYTPAPAPAMK